MQTAKTINRMTTLHIRVPEATVNMIDEFFGARKRSEFLKDIADRELKRLRMVRAFKRAAGAWKDKDHPELKHGAAAYIRKLRQESERSFRKKFPL